MSPFCLKGRVLQGAYRFQAVITTFEMILGGCPELNAIEWRCVVIDEAHRLKNKNCKLLEGFKLMSLVHILMIQKETALLILKTNSDFQNIVSKMSNGIFFPSYAI